MKYVDGILRDWSSRDIKTLDAVKRNAEQHDREQEKNKNTYRVSEKNTRFVNFDQRKNDHDELERLELEQFRQSVMKG
jgi:DNA replication protein DnaD